MSKKSMNLDDLVLSAAAKRVRAQFTDSELKELLKAPAMSKKSALQRLADLPLPIQDSAIVACIMAMQKSRCSQGDFARAYSHIQRDHTDYALSWLNGARDLCTALIELKEQTDKGGYGANNIVNASGFKELVQYLRDGLEIMNARDAKIFRFGTELAQIITVAEEDTATIQVLNLDQFTAAIPIQFEKKTDKKLTSAPPPLEVVKKVYNTPNLPLPYLAGLTRFPTFGEDGSLHSEPGYSKATGTFYVPPVDLDIPALGGWQDNGARQRDLAEAKRLLVEELLADFPFDGWSRERIMAAFNGQSNEGLPASLLNALAIPLTVLVRSMIAGPVPLSLVTKAQAGTGSTFLVEVMQIIVAGIASVRAPLATGEDERRKSLFSAIQTSEPIILYDNLKGTLDSPALASVLTSTTFTDRVLGRSAERRLPVRSVFTCTSNNLLLSEELQRRVSLVRLHAQTADPKSRDNWRHPALNSWAEANRGALLWALMVFVANWVHRGCQGPSQCPAVPSYGGWCYTIAGIFEAADSRWVTFQHNRDDIGKFADAGESDGIGELVENWAAMGGDKTATDIAEIIEAESIEIDGLKVGQDGSPSVVSVGKQLAAYSGRRFAVDGRELELAIVGERKKAKLWALVDKGAVKVKPASVGVSGPLVPPKYRAFPLHDDPVSEGGDLVGLAIQPPPLADHRPRRGSRADITKRRKAAQLARSA